VPEPSNHTTRGSFLCLQRFILFVVADGVPLSVRNVLEGRGHTDSVRNRQEVGQFARRDNSPSKKSPGHRHWLPCSIRPASCIATAAWFVAACSRRCSISVGNSDRRDPATNTLTFVLDPRRNTAMDVVPSAPFSRAPVLKGWPKARES
jgi:hypothetical protein